MSTQTLQMLVNMTGCSGAAGCLHCRAQAELSAIRTAALDLQRRGVEWDQRTTKAWELMGVLAMEERTPAIPPTTSVAAPDGGCDWCGRRRDQHDAQGRIAEECGGFLPA